MIATQYHPIADLNARLLASGASKTVYALVTPETEFVKAQAFGNHGDENRREFFGQFREAWTGKQDALHEDFFSTWYEWSKPVLCFDRVNFPFCYPTAGASEPLRQIIFDFAAHGGEVVHAFTGEYEGYRAMAEAAGLSVVEHDRATWRGNLITDLRQGLDLFCISQPSAIDGNVWHDFNDFVSLMPNRTVMADVTYVGAIPKSSITTRFNLDAEAITDIVFSLSKPFGCYYDRIGGVFCRKQNLGLFGNKWFKSLTALRIGTMLMQTYNVFSYPERYGRVQRAMIEQIGDELGIILKAADVFILGTGDICPDDEMGNYIRRAGKLRVCLTPGMSKMIGTTGEIR